MTLDIDPGFIEQALAKGTGPSGGELVPVVQEAKWQDLVREVVPLVPEDLEALQQAGPARSQAGLQHIRAFHHVIALKLATGERPVQICAALSITPQTITRLQKDAQFQELVEGYREKLVDKAIDHFELMEMVAGECLIAMHEKLVSEEERPLIGFESLRRTAETLVDRIGHSPIRRSETLNRHEHSITDDSIRRIRDLHAEDTTYEAEIVRESEVKALPEDTGGQVLKLSISDGFKPVAKEEAQRVKGEGADV